MLLSFIKGYHIHTETSVVEGSGIVPITDSAWENQGNSNNKMSNHNE